MLGLDGGAIQFSSEGPWKYECARPDGAGFANGENADAENHFARSTRSHNARKAIRPAGYRFAHLDPPSGFCCVADGLRQFRGRRLTNFLATEELAELYALI
jgi:hypothetical protein